MDELGPHVIADGPVGAYVAPHDLDQVAGNLGQVVGPISRAPIRLAHDALARADDIGSDNVVIDLTRTTWPHGHRGGRFR